MVSGYPFLPSSAESGLQGFAPTGSPGFGSLGCGLVVCLRSFGFRLATDTLPFLAIARIQSGEQVFHLQESNTAGHTLKKNWQRVRSSPMCTCMAWPHS